MILLDNSQYMRNADYIPTRLQAQADAANVIAGAILHNNNESTVGIAASCSNSGGVIVSPTDGVGGMHKILSAVHAVQLSDTASKNSSGAKSSEEQPHLGNAVAVASLALKHRRNKLGSQRVVCFVGTPVTADIKSLQKTGRMLRKNNVVLDVVGLGEHEANREKLQALVDAANGNAVASADVTVGHYVPIPEGVLPSDVLASSPILGGGGAAAGAAAAAAANGFAEFGGVDPNMDPELAMALRVSMEEERARQERAAEGQQETGGEAATNADGAPELSEDEALLQQALAMSMNENEPSTEDSKPAAAATEEDAHMEDVEDELDEDAATQMALQMSMQNGVEDQEFVQGMLEDMKEDKDEGKKDEDKKE